MNLRRGFCVFVMSALLLATTSPALMAGEVSGAVHVATPAQLHQAVQDSSKKANDARNYIQAYIDRPEVSAQIQHYGLGVADVKSRVAMLSETELMLVQKQIMNEDLQKATVGGMTKTGKTLLIIGLCVAGAGAVMLAAGSEEDEIGDSDVAINWKVTGAIWMGAGAVLAIIGLTRHEH